MIGLLLCVIMVQEDPFFETEEEQDFEFILKDIEYLRDNPLDINAVDAEALSRIPYLTLADCLKIVHYREQYGLFHSIRDLARIPGFDPVKVKTIEPYITIMAKPLRIEKLSSRIRLATKIPAREQSLEYYTKFHGMADQYSVSVVTERDPYEDSFFDYYAAGLILSEGKRTIALGSYSVDVGPGVMLSSIGSFFNAVDFRLMIHERGIVPYTSTVENGGLFGAALSDSLLFPFTIFYSNQKLDGRIDSLGDARSFDESGEHTDSLSVSRKDRIREELVGYDIRYHWNAVEVSNRSYWCSYDPGFTCRDSTTQFYGDRFWMSGVGIKYVNDRYVLFSEWARSFENRVGGLFGLTSFYSHVDVSCAGRYFPAGFYSPNGIESKEDYIGGTVDIQHHSRLADIGMTVTIDGELEEDSTQYGLQFNLNKRVGIVQTRLKMRWRYTSDIWDRAGSRVFFRITPIRTLFLDVRFEEKYVRTSTEVERGIFGAVEVGTTYKNVGLRIRYGRFMTDSYASRIYAYEIDLPGIINNRALYNNGEYGFIYCTFKLLRQLQVSLKYFILKRDSSTIKHFGCQLDSRL
jgi:hypothetical protein